MGRYMVESEEWGNFWDLEEQNKIWDEGKQFLSEISIEKMCKEIYRRGYIEPLCKIGWEILNRADQIQMPLDRQRFIYLRYPEVLNRWEIRYGYLPEFYSLEQIVEEQLTYDQRIFSQGKGYFRVSWTERLRANDTLGTEKIDEFLKKINR